MFGSIHPTDCGILTQFFHCFSRVSVHSKNFKFFENSPETAPVSAGRDCHLRPQKRGPGKTDSEERRLPESASFPQGHKRQKNGVNSFVQKKGASMRRANPDKIRTNPTMASLKCLLHLVYLNQYQTAADTAALIVREEKRS